MIKKNVEYGLPATPKTLTVLTTRFIPFEVPVGFNNKLIASLLESPVSLINSG